MIVRRARVGGGEGEDDARYRSNRSSPEARGVAVELFFV